MPELPEVETVRLQLWKKVKGKKIAKVKVFNTKTVGHDASFARKLIGQKIVDIDRIGKLLIFKFDVKQSYMLGHLKMTGQFFFTDKAGKLAGGGGHSPLPSDAVKFPGPHTRVAIGFSDGSHLYFNDMRLFGYLRLTDEAGLSAARMKFGPEPISETFDGKEFAQKLKKKKTAIKAVLLDQSFIAGLGNIYVDEALFQSKIRPDRKADTLTAEEAKRLSKAAGAVLLAAIKNGGTTFQNFIDTEGQTGGHAKHLKVFGHQGKKCPRCGGIIIKTRVAGRGTHFCPQCQK